MLLAVLSAYPACGQSSVPSLDSGFIKTGQANTRLIAETPFVPGQTTWFALDQKLAEHWHVYWKNPGDSGLPLVMDFTLPDGYTVGEINYPAPEPIAIGPLVNFGYNDDPVFLVPVSVPVSATPGETIIVSVFASWLICEDVCIPEEATFTVDMPIIAQGEIEPNYGEIFTSARAAMPVPFPGEATYSGDANGLSLILTPADAVANALSAKDAFFFAQPEGVLKPSAPQKATMRDSILEIALTPDFAFDAAQPKPMRGVLTYVSSTGVKRAFDLTANPVPSSQSVAAAGGATTTSSIANSTIALPLLLAMAFFGGILLNVMPCVFPILFIKASSLMSSAAEDQRTIRAHGWLYTAGVVATFAVMGALLLLLRAQGERIGWGFQLQSPIVVLVSAYVLFLVGLNLAGVFHVGTSLQGVGQGLSEKRGGLGAFFTGMLAVVVAAPCIGPLLSAPMGAAVFLPSFWGMMIFVLMALGLAAPYLLLSLIPSLGKRLPKPGAWMETFKQFLSFPVFAAAAYFLWVLAAQTGSTGLAIGFIGLLLLAIAAWLFETTKSGKWQSSGAIIAVLLLVAALLPLSTLKPVTAIAGEGGKHGAIVSEVFNPERIADLNAAGTPVFVDFTAAWCVTCQFNKLTVFSSDKVADAIEQSGATFMVADWTVRDPMITEALEAFGRNGVPLYVWYPSNGHAQILPLPLTEGTVIKAVSNL